jgi:hypothetical protein
MAELQVRECDCIDIVIKCIHLGELNLVLTDHQTAYGVGLFNSVEDEWEFIKHYPMYQRSLAEAIFHDEETKLKKRMEAND